MTHLGFSEHSPYIEMSLVIRHMEQIQFVGWAKVDLVQFIEFFQSKNTITEVKLVVFAKKDPILIIAFNLLNNRQGGLRCHHLV